MISRFFKMALAIVSILSSAVATAQQDNAAAERAARLRQADVASLKPDNDVYKLPWDTIMESDLTWAKRVWREVDASQKSNEPFAAGNRNLANILLNGAINGKLKAYDGKDGRFVKEVTAEELNAISGAADVKKYRIKEDWLYVASRKEMVVRIVGIAPVANVKDADGTYTEQALFWIFYPDARVYLTLFQATERDNWDQLLESRKFGSQVKEIKERPVMKAMTPKQ